MNDRPHNGWHWTEWTSECAGTAFLMFTVVSTWYWLDRAGGAWATVEVRVPLLAVTAGCAVIAAAYSPPGRRSGAHLNPAVTVGLWLQKTVGTADLAGYTLAQTVGGIGGAALCAVWGSRVAEPPVEWGAIAPHRALPPSVALAAEVGATACQLLVVYLMLRSRRAASWTAVVAGLLLGVAIVGLARVSGAGFNPVRGVAPDLLRWSFPGAWIYLVGPLTGAVIGARLVLVAGEPVTGKLHHDARQPCYMRCLLPHPEQERPDASPGTAGPGQRL